MSTIKNTQIRYYKILVSAWDDSIEKKQRNIAGTMENAYHDFYLFFLWLCEIWDFKI